MAAPGPSVLETPRWSAKDTLTPGSRPLTFYALQLFRHVQQKLRQPLLVAALHLNHPIAYQLPAGAKAPLKLRERICIDVIEKNKNKSYYC